MTQDNKLVIAAITGASLAAAVAAGVIARSGWLEARPSSMSQIASASVSQPAAGWDRLHRAELVGMKSDADGRAVAGKWREAYERYQQILTLVADHELTDPISLAAATGAATNQDRVMQLLNERNATAQAEVPVSSAPVSSVPETATAISGTQSIAGSPADEQPTKRLDMPTPVVQAPAQTPAETKPAAGMFGNRSPAGSSPGAAPSKARTNSTDSVLSSLSDLSDNTNLTDSSPQSSTTYERTPGEPVPEIIFKRVAQSTPGTNGSATQTVTVTVGPRPAGSPPVTGTVDGHSYSIGGPGEPSSVSFSGLPVTTLPVSVNGQSYGLAPGQTLNFALPNSAPSPPNSAPSSAAPRQPGNSTGPVTGGPDGPTKPPVAPAPPAGKHPVFPVK